MKTHKLFLTAIFAVLVLTPSLSFAKIRVVATLPWIASVTEGIGGDMVEVKTLVKGNQDPHAIEAKPSMILAVRQADILIYNGAELEVAFMPILMESSRNPVIQSGKAGNLDLSQFARLIERPSGPIDRSLGDIHPSGNPHYHLSPDNVLSAARGICERLSSIDGENANFYESRLEAFEKTLRKRIKEWVEIMAPLQRKKVILYHKDMNYLMDSYGIVVAGYIEPKPGIPPTPRHLQSLIETGKKVGISAVLVNTYFEQRSPSFVAEKTGVKMLTLPIDVNGIPEAADYISLMDYITKTMKDGLR